MQDTPDAGRFARLTRVRDVPLLSGRGRGPGVDPATGPLSDFGWLHLGNQHEIVSAEPRIAGTPAAMPRPHSLGK